MPNKEQIREKAEELSDYKYRPRASAVDKLIEMATWAIAEYERERRQYPVKLVGGVPTLTTCREAIKDEYPDKEPTE